MRVWRCGGSGVIPAEDAQIGSKRPHFRFRGIGARLAVNFSVAFVVVLTLVELIGIGGVPFTTYEGRRGRQEKDAFASLDLIADLKQDRLERWLVELRSNIEAVSKNRLVARSVARLLAEVKVMSASGKQGDVLWTQVRGEAEYKELRRFLDLLKATYRVYDQIEIADAETGVVLVSTDDMLLGSEVRGQPHFEAALRLGEVYIGHVAPASDGLGSVLRISHVVRDAGPDGSGQAEGRPIAVIAMMVDTEDLLRPILHTGEGLGGTGEALLVNSDGWILTSLKHPLMDGSTPDPLEYRVTDSPAVLAARGEEGRGEAEDYRDEPVLAAYRHVRVTPEWGWGLVVKQDRAELLAPLRQDMIEIFSFGLAGVVAFVALSFALARTLTRPLRNLGRTAELVAACDLSARITVSTNDEMGLFATTFNATLDRIQNWREELESEVRVRTSELRESERRARATFEQAAIGVVHAALDGSFLDVNDKFLEMLGYTRGELLGMSFQDITHADDLEEDLGQQRRILSGEIKTFSVEKRYLHNYGFVFWGHLTLSLVRDRAGEPDYFIAVVEDISERRRAEEARIRMSAELARQYRELEQIIYVVSHDLRSPLVNVQGFSNELATSLGELKSAIQATGGNEDDRSRAVTLLDVDIPESTRFIQASVTKMNSLLDGLLRISRLGRSTLEIRDLDMDQIVAEAVDTLEFQIQTAGATVSVGPLPPCRGDVAQIGQVFSNLLDNALKFLDARRPGIINISGQTRDGMAVYAVEDNGAGIDFRHLDRIFELYHRLDPVAVEGEGLGLTIIRMILDRHGGRVWVDSDPGGGSVFFVSLPLQHDGGAEG